MKRISLSIFSLLGFAIVLASCNHTSGRNRNLNMQEKVNPETPSITIIGQPDSEIHKRRHVTKGCNSDFEICMPAPLSDMSEQIVQKKAYIVSYNKDTKLPNWVAWRLTADHTDGPVRRMNTFYEEECVASPRATLDDYRGSGWSRGHMCPAGDNKWDERAMYESFSLVNVCPQNASLNSGLWNSIEIDCRRWANRFGDIFIVCGPVLYNMEHETIGVNKMVVPEAFFKVILCTQGEPKAIGFVVKNNAGNRKKDQYVNTVDDVERITGYDFFPSLPDSIEDKVEAYSNIEDWR